MKKIIVVFGMVFVIGLVTGTIGCLQKTSGDPRPRVRLNPGEIQALNCDRFQKFTDLLKIKKAAPAPTSADAAGEQGRSEATDSPATVREADFVKAAGSTLYHVRNDPNDWSQGTFNSFGVGEDGGITPLDSLPLPGNPVEFLLAGHRALLIANGYSGEENGLLIHEVDLTDPADLRLTQTFFIGGASYVTSRLVGETAHFVVSSWIETSFVPETKEILPHYKALKVDGTEGPATTLGACGSTFIADEMLDDDLSDSSLLSVVSLPLGGSELSSSSVLYEGWTPVVSVSPESIYIGTELDEKSRIYKFDLTADPTQAVYAAEGLVPGRLTTAYAGGGYNDQFSMDEYQGVLRVATTSGELNRTGRSSAVSSLTLLRQDGDELKVVGELNDLHHGEAVYAVRFLGDRGYVVTFKKVDPLFIVDLSDPTSPTIQGELQLPGFSTHLTPLDGRHLLAIGKDADDQGTFAWYQGVNLSLFDVGDPSSPRLVDRVTIGKRGTESEALNDYRAFSLFTDRGLVAFPVDLVTEVSETDEGGWRPIGSPDHSEEEVWAVDSETGFSLRGAIRHDDLETAGEPVPSVDYCFDWCYTPHVQLRRAVEVNGKLVTISDAGIKVHDFGDLATDLASIAFP